VRWLSGGAVLKRFFDLRKEINTFLIEKGKSVPELTDPQWLIDLGFLADLTHELNMLNMELQGKNKLVSHMHTDVKAFQMKNKLFIKYIDEKKLDHFPNCKKAVEEVGMNFHWKNDKMKCILMQLQNQFNDRFCDFEKVSGKMKIFANPFSCDIDDVPSNLQMNVIDLQSNDTLKNSFYEINDLVKFYGSFPSNFNELKRFAQQLITIFGSTYLCEQTFSILNYRKNKYCSRLTNEHLSAILRICIAKCDWSFLHAVNDVNVAVGLFYEKLYDDMFRQFVPLNRANSLHYPVWYTSDIIRKLKHKFKVFKRYKKTMSRSTLIEFRNLRRDLKISINATYHEYISTVEQQLTHDPRCFWSFVNHKRKSNAILYYRERLFIILRKEFFLTINDGFSVW
jgi:hypothetical protein